MKKNIQKTALFIDDLRINHTSNLEAGALLSLGAGEGTIESRLQHLHDYERVVFTYISQDIINYVQSNPQKQYSFQLFSACDPGDIDVIKKWGHSVIDLQDAGIKFLTPSTKIKDVHLTLISNEIGKDIACIGEEYLSIWQHFIDGKTLPKTLTIYTWFNNTIPDWFISNLQEYGVALHHEVLTLSAIVRGNLIKKVKRSGAPVLSFSKEINQLDIYFSYHGVEIKKPNQTNCLVPKQAQITHRDLWHSHPQSSLTTTQAKPRKKAPVKINVVCYNPTYLFKDLCDRFVAKGCVHSELPLENADGYIWIRPQEYIAFQAFLAGEATMDVPGSYLNRLKKEKVSLDTYHKMFLQNRSVVIHHGTCFEPLYQFSPHNFAVGLASVKAVAGVCEFHECYGPSAYLANSNNFHFCPIGYDHTLYHKEILSKRVRKPGSKIHIGFVGRAYGTNDPKALERSRLAHPKGYRKGGDHALNILLRLKALGIKFHFHIVGQNWDELVTSCERMSLPITYYTRDHNITYQDYPKLFAKFDMLLLPARAEGGPVAAIEGMSMGTYIVGSNVGMMSHLARTTPYCKVFRYDTHWHVADYDQAVESITNIYEQEQSLKERLKIRASIEHFTTDNWVLDLMKIAGHDA